jgi:hypothetical protein
MFYIFIFLYCISVINSDYLHSLNGFKGASSITNCISNDPPNFVPAVMKASKNVSFPYPTHKWYSSLLWRRCLDLKQSLGSLSMYPHPLGLTADLDGLRITYPKEFQVYEDPIYPFVSAFKIFNDPYDFKVTLVGLQSSQANLVEVSDMHICIEWKDDSKILRARTGRGIPYVYFEKTCIH